MDGAVRLRHPHKGVNKDAYANASLKKQGEILAAATTFRFDGSDLMPGKIGAGAFWTGMVDFVGGQVGAGDGRRDPERPGTKSSKATKIAGLKFQLGGAHHARRPFWQER